MANPLDAWMQIPSSVLDLGQRTADAEAWATAQRAKVAETWANVQRQAVSTMATTWQQGMDSLDHFGEGFAGSATPPQQGPQGYNDMAGADTSPQGPLSSLQGQPEGIQAAGTPGTQLLPGSTPLTDIPGNVRDAAVTQVNNTADAYNYAFQPTPGTRADQPARSQVVGGGKALSRFTPEQLQGQQEQGFNAVLGVGGEGIDAGKVAAPVVQDVGAAVGRWGSLKQVASKLGVDLGEHNTILDMENEAINLEHALGTPSHDAATTELHNSYVSSTANDLKATLNEKIGQAQEQLSGMQEALDPAMVDAYKKYWDPNSRSLRSFSVKEWQDAQRQGNRMAIAPDSILMRDERYPNQQRVQPRYLLDVKAENLGYPDMNDFEKALEKTGKYIQQVNQLKGQVSDLNQVGKQLTSLQRQASGLPDVAGAAVAPGKLPLSTRMQDFLSQSKGTPEERARIIEKVVADPQNEADVFLKHVPEDIRPYMRDVGGQFGQNFAGRRRGVVHDDEAAKNAVQAASGMSIEQLMRTPAGKAFNDSEILALGSTLNNLGSKLDQLMNDKKIGQQLGRWSSSKEETLAQTALQMGVVSSLFRGSQAEAGRALRSFNQVMGGEAMISAKAIGKAAERFGVKPGDVEQVGPLAAPGSGGVNRPGAYQPPKPEVAIPPSTGGDVKPIFAGDKAGGFTPDLPGVTLPKPEAKPIPGTADQAALQTEIPGITPEKPQTANPFEGAANAEEQAAVDTGAAATGGGSHEERLQRAFKAIGTDAQRFQDWVQAWQATPVADYTTRYKLLQVLVKHQLKDYANEWLYNAMLSNPSTHVANMVSNTVNALSGPAERFTAAAIDAPLSALQGRPRGRFFGEAGANAYGLLQGLPEGVRAATYALQHGFTIREAMKAENPRMQAFGGLAGNVLNTPSRLLNAADAFMQPIMQRGALNAEIYRRASSEGLKGQALTDRIAELTTNVPDDLMEHAGKMAEYQLYRQKPKTFANAMTQMRGLSVYGVEPMRFIIPFVQVPVNATKYGLERTPLGVLNPDLWKNLAAKDPAASDNLARFAMGSMVAAGIGSLVGTGNLDITGAAPTSPAQRDAFYRQGKLPFSIKIGGTWLSYQRWEPMNHSLTQVAAAVDAIRGAKQGQNAFDLGTQAALTIGQNVLSQSFLTGINSLMNAAADPQRYGSQLASQLETSALPFSAGMRATANAFDPRQRSPQGAIENAESVIPGLSRNVPSNLNNYGEEQNQPGNPFLPYKWQQANDSPLESELARLKVEPGSTGKTLRGIDLTRQENADHQRVAGQQVKQLLTQLVADPRYRALNDTQKAKALELTITHAKDAAAQQFLTGLVQQQGQQQILQRIQQKKLAALPRAG